MCPGREIPTALSRRQAAGGPKSCTTINRALPASEATCEGERAESLRGAPAEAAMLGRVRDGGRAGDRDTAPRVRASVAVPEHRTRLKTGAQDPQAPRLSSPSRLVFAVLQRRHGGLWDGEEGAG